MKAVRLDRLLGNLGYGSRKEIAAMARAGRVTLDGIALKKPDANIDAADAAGGRLLLDGERLDPIWPLAVMLHKPPGYSCSHDEKGALIYDLLPPRWRNRSPALSSVGRLDKDSTGQLLLTDDGDLLHRIIHPKRHAAKYYEVTLMQELLGEEAALFASGAFLMQGDARPLKPAEWRASTPCSGIMILQEGRFHQIRRMFETIGNRVTALHRFRTGGLELGDLAQGAYRLLNEEDMARLFSESPA